MKKLFERFLKEEQTYDEGLLWDDLLLWDGGIELPPDPNKQPVKKFKVIGGSGTSKRKEIKLNIDIETNLLTLNQKKIKKNNSLNKSTKLKGSLQIPKIETLAYGVSNAPNIIVEVEDFYFTSQRLSDEKLISLCLLEDNSSQ